MKDTEAAAFSAAFQAELSGASVDELIRGLHDLTMMKDEFKDSELYDALLKIMAQRLYLKTLTKGA